MSIRVTCSSCNNELVVSDSKAGMDLECPHCQRLVAVPSIMTGWRDRPGDEPEPRDRGRDRDPYERGRPSRWDDRYEYEEPPRRDNRRWSTTLSGLTLVFWAIAILVVFTEISGILNLAMAGDPMAMIGGPGDLSPMAILVMTVGCVVIGLAIMGFVGMCMCCTVPQESGAKGKAIATVVMIVSLIVIVIIAAVVIFASAMHEARRGPAALGQLPVTGAALVFVFVGLAVANIVITAVWLLFHKAIANHYHNDNLARQTIWFILIYALQVIGGYAFQLLANKDLLRGDFLAPNIDPTMNMVATLWGMAWSLALAIWYLFICSATRRTILEGEGSGMHGEERGY